MIGNGEILCFLLQRQMCKRTFRQGNSLMAFQTYRIVCVISTMQAIQQRSVFHGGFLLYKPFLFKRSQNPVNRGKRIFLIGGALLYQMI